MGNLKPNVRTAKIAVIAFWIILVLNIISFISGYMQYQLLETITYGEDISIEAAELNDQREQIIAILLILAYLVSGITFIVWFRRAYYNLHQKVSILSYSVNWAVGCWFVPFINLYRPFEILREIFMETEDILIKNGLIESKVMVIPILKFWWTYILISKFINWFTFRYTLSAETIDQLINSTVINMITNVLEIPLALLTIKIINNYSKVEPLLNEIKEEEPPIPFQTEFRFSRL